MPRSAEECRVVPGRGGADIGVFKPRSAEECRVVPGRGGADIGEPLNYSTTIAIPQTVCGAEECREVPRSAE